jgi:hypothetical protein
MTNGLLLIFGRAASTESAGADDYMCFRTEAIISLQDFQQPSGNQICSYQWDMPGNRGQIYY